MTGNLTLSQFIVTDSPNKGVKYWTVYLTLENFDQIQSHDNDELRGFLRGHGTQALVRGVSMTYTAAAPGQRVQPAIGVNSQSDRVLESMIVTDAPDQDTLDWPGLFVPLNLNEKATYTIAVNVLNYAATDDIRIMLSGEVW